MITETHGWGTVYSNDDGKFVATVSKCRVWDHDTTYCVEMFHVKAPWNNTFNDLVRSESHNELKAHLTAQNFVKGKS